MILITFSCAIAAQSLTLSDLNKLMIGNDIAQKDAYLSRYNFIMHRTDDYNYNWKMANSNEKIYLLIAGNKIHSLDYYTEDANTVNRFFSNY